MLKLIETSAELLKKQGIDSFDIYGIDSAGFSVEVKEGRVERIKVPQRKGLAIRVVVEDKLGFSYTNDVSEDGIRVAIECARENARNSSPDEYSFSMPSESSLDFPLYDDTYPSIPVERKVEVALELEDKCRSLDRRVNRVRKASYSDSFSTVYYCNSNGHLFSYTVSNYSLSVLLAAKEGDDSQVGWDYDVRRFFTELNPDLVAARAVESAVELLGASPMETKRIPVIFKNVVFAELVEALSGAFLGHNVMRGKSLFADKLSREVASHVLNIYDDPFQREGMGSFPFDDEGVPAKRTAIIERGVLKNFLVDMYSARKLGLPLTGNGIRSSLASLPQPGISNLVIERGALGLEELVKTPEEVLIVTDAMGVHTVNAITGEFSVGVSGVYYRDGRRVQPVTGMTVAGNLKDLLMNITEVGRDQRWVGNICSPSVLVKELTVGGE
ncbi:MAG: TldD/PmbA family protein [Desulfurobacteriaceae bacterium]